MFHLSEVLLHLARTSAVPSSHFSFSSTVFRQLHVNKWDDTEVQAIERHMMDFIKQQKVPQKSDCIKCLEAENEALRDRSWKGVKNYVRNRITTLQNAKKASKTVKKRCIDEGGNESEGGSSDKNQSQHPDGARLDGSEGESPVDIF